MFALNLRPSWPLARLTSPLISHLPNTSPAGLIAPRPSITTGSHCQSSLLTQRQLTCARVWVGDLPFSSLETYVQCPICSRCAIYFKPIVVSCRRRGRSLCPDGSAE